MMLKALGSRNHTLRIVRFAIKFPRLNAQRSLVQLGGHDLTII